MAQNVVDGQTDYLASARDVERKNGWKMRIKKCVERVILKDDELSILQQAIELNKNLSTLSRSP
jgi:hypothetical protein